MAPIPQPRSRTLLVVDDDAMVREVLADGLEMAGYEVRQAGNAGQAMEEIRRGGIGLVLSDIDMPGENGIVLLGRIKEHDPDVDVVMVTGLTDVEPAINSMRQGASDYVTKPFLLEEVRLVVHRTLENRRLVLENRAYQQHLEEMVQERTAELLQKKQEVERLYHDLREAWEGTVQALLVALDLRDNETQGHSWRVVDYAVLLAERMGIRGRELSWIRLGSIFHDIGKIGVPDAILRKPGALDPPEWTEMQKHPEMGFRMLQGIRFLEPVLEIVLCHEERWDGSGYPRGLKGEQIPLGARIFAVVDTFDAITTDRPYRMAQEIDRAREEIRQHAGTQFDPRVAEVFLSIEVEALKEIRERAMQQAVALEERIRRMLD